MSWGGEAKASYMATRNWNSAMMLRSAGSVAVLEGLLQAVLIRMPFRVLVMMVILVELP